LLSDHFSGKGKKVKARKKRK